MKTSLPGRAAVLAALVLGCAGVLAAPASAQVSTVQGSAQATVGNTDGDGLTIRTGPHTSSGSLGLAWDGQVVTLSCQAHGDTVTNTKGFTSDLWDYVPQLSGYLADAYMNTGYDGRIPGVPECDGGGSSGSTVPVSQYQGQANQYEDCGPTSVVTALLKIGVTPRQWSSGNPVAAINRVRSDMGYDPSWQDPAQFGTNEADVQGVLRGYGVDAWTSYDLDEALAHVRAGRPAIMAGNMIDLPWSGHDVAHFMTIASYSGGSYTVLDPATSPYRFTATAGTLGAFWDHDYGRAAVLL